MPAAGQFLWSNHTMVTCRKWIGGIVRRRACFLIRLLEIILISSSEGAEQTWCIVEPHSRNVTFFCHMVDPWNVLVLHKPPYNNILHNVEADSCGTELALYVHWDTGFKYTNCYSKLMKSSGLFLPGVWNTDRWWWYLEAWCCSTGKCLDSL